MSFHGAVRIKHCSDFRLCFLHSQMQDHSKVIYCEFGVKRWRPRMMSYTCLGNPLKTVIKRHEFSRRCSDQTWFRFQTLLSSQLDAGRSKCCILWIWRQTVKTADDELHLPWKSTENRNEKTWVFTALFGSNIVPISDSAFFTVRCSVVQRSYIVNLASNGEDRGWWAMLALKIHRKPL